MSSIDAAIGYLTIKGFKSIRLLNRFPLKALNVLIGSNGAGKSNFVSYFRMLGEMMEGRLQNWTTKQGSADRIVSFGIKTTDAIESEIEFDRNTQYRFRLEPTVDGGFSYACEEVFYDGPPYGRTTYSYGSGKESLLNEKIKGHREKRSLSSPPDEAERFCSDAISSWKVFHFQDTGDTAGVKLWGALHDNVTLRSDASNLAAYLYRLSQETPDAFLQIRDVVRLAIPFFDNFVLRPRALTDAGEEQIALLWRQRNSDYELWPSQLSDGSIRFICLATALLQSNPPSTIVIDEPELGLHPYAITLLGSLLKSAANRIQVIVSTQSVSLVDEFSIDDLVVVEREDEASVFRRSDERAFKLWLEEYSVGELWEKNVLGGRPSR